MQSSGMMILLDFVAVFPNPGGAIEDGWQHWVTLAQANLEATLNGTRLPIKSEERRKLAKLGQPIFCYAEELLRCSMTRR